MRTDGTVNETTRLAQRDTVLSPRFYTTDFAAMDRLDVAPVRREWDELMAEFARDANKGHFIRNGDFDLDLDALPDDLRRGVHRFSGQLIDRGVLRLRAVRGNPQAGNESGHS